jgi:hypothetical protein
LWQFEQPAVERVFAVFTVFRCFEGIGMNLQVYIDLMCVAETQDEGVGLKGKMVERQRKWQRFRICRRRQTESSQIKHLTRVLLETLNERLMVGAGGIRFGLRFHFQLTSRLLGLDLTSDRAFHMRHPAH